MIPMMSPINNAGSSRVSSGLSTNPPSIARSLHAIFVTVTPALPRLPDPPKLPTQFLQCVLYLLRAAAHCLLQGGVVCQSKRSAGSCGHVYHIASHLCLAIFASTIRASTNSFFPHTIVTKYRITFHAHRACGIKNIFRWIRRSFGAEKMFASEKIVTKSFHTLSRISYPYYHLILLKYLLGFKEHGGIIKIPPFESASKRKDQKVRYHEVLCRVP